MDPCDCLVLVLLCAAFFGLAYMIQGKREPEPLEPDPRWLKAQVRAERTLRDLSTEEPRYLSPERLEAWRAARKAKVAS